jgi:hypothetical protein
MGKKPVFGMVSFCWLGLALAGCDTFNSNSTVPTGRFQSQARPTFGNNKDTTLSKNPSLPDATVQTKATDPRIVPDRPAGFDPGAPGTGVGLVGNSPKATDRIDMSTTGGRRTPGAAGLVDVPTPGTNTTPTIMDAKKTWPMSGADDGVTEISAPSSSTGPVMPARTPALPPLSTGVALPPAPSSASGSVLPAGSPGTKLPPLSMQRPIDARPLPAAPPPAKGVDVPPPSLPAALQPAEQDAPIYEVPPPSAPPAPAPSAPAPAEKTAAPSDSPPPLPPVPPLPKQ